MQGYLKRCERSFIFCLTGALEVNLIFSGEALEKKGIAIKICLNAYTYGFNGKEKDSDGEWGSSTHYDYGFRIYNPSIGKFLSVDPLTRSFPSWTPYSYSMDRPIDGVDLDGLERVHYMVNTRKSRTGENMAVLSYAGTQESRAVQVGWITMNLPLSPEVVLWKANENGVNIGYRFSDIGSAYDAAKMNFEGIDPYDAANTVNAEQMWLNSFAKSSQFIGNVGAVLGNFNVQRIANQSKGVDIKLKYKAGWTDAQKEVARLKADALSTAKTQVVKNPQRQGNARSRYKQAGGNINDSEDLDHVIDLQLGGADEIMNMEGLDKSVNRSMGSQIQNQIKGLPEGTKVNKVYFVDE